MFMRRAGLGSKLAVLVLALGVPLAAVVWLYLETLGAHRIDVARRIDGVQAVRLVRGLLESALESQDAPGTISLDAVVSEGRRAGLSSESAARIEDSLSDINSNPASRVEAMAGLIADLGDQTGLTLDPDPSARAAGRIVSVSIPSAARLLRAPKKAEPAPPIEAAIPETLDSGAIAVVDPGEAAPQEPIAVTPAALSTPPAAEVRFALRRFQQAQADLAAADPPLAARIESVSAQAANSLAAWAAEQESSWAGPPDDAYRRKAAAGLFALEDALLSELNQRLGLTLATLQKDRYVQIGGAVFVLALGLAAALLLYRSSIEQLADLKSTIEHVSRGDFSVRATVRGNDEIAQVAETLNEMIEDSALRVQSAEERERMEKSIERLLKDIAGVAEGDLTHSADSDSELTNSIALSFNYMIGELRTVISQVQNTTMQVSAAANQIQSATEQVAQGSRHQSARIADAASAIDEITGSIKHVSNNAAEAAKVAQDALANARRGVDAVAKTIAGMGSIRKRVQETAKRIKRLGESSQEIGAIVQLIGDVADRTSILALNAAIQAAGAGESGRGFAVVAEEIERLAERASEATQQISALIQSIQGDARAAVGAMEDATSEVVGGSSLANEAGGTLEQIEGVSQQLAVLIQSISAASQQQAHGSDSVARSMSDISDVTQQTASGAGQAAASIRNLAKLTDDLRESVKRFRLPADIG